MKSTSIRTLQRERKKHISTQPQTDKYPLQRYSRSTVKLLSGILPKFTYHYIIVKGNNSQLVRRLLLLRQCWSQSANSQFNFLWKPTSFLSTNLKKSNKRRIFNHIQSHDQLTNKAKLYLNLTRQYQKRTEDIQDIIPKTFALNLDSGSSLQVLQFFLEIFFLVKNSTSLKNFWIFKPAQLNRGRGISCFNSLPQLINLLEQYLGLKNSLISASAKPQILKQHLKNLFTRKSRGKLQRWIILQKYIQCPLLYKGRKFDIRMWVLLDSEGKAYIYREGYVRLCSQKYDLSSDNIQNSFIHLTNNAIQKYSPSYGSKQLGNQMSIRQLQSMLKRGMSWFKKQVNEIVKISINSVHKNIWTKGIKPSFQLLGYDFMLDSEENIYLIEINTNPCLEESSPLLQELIPCMINHTLQRTVDQLLPVSKSLVEGISQSLRGPLLGLGKQNLWQQIYEVQRHN